MYRYFPDTTHSTKIKIAWSYRFTLSVAFQSMPLFVSGSQKFETKEFLKNKIEITF